VKLLYWEHNFGGKYFEIIKSLITGSVREQSLEETLNYFSEHLLDQGVCYTRIGKESYTETRQESRQIFESLIESCS